MLKQVKENAVAKGDSVYGGLVYAGDGSRHIFNHPLLKYYHNEQAMAKKEQIEENNYKQKFFLLHKWGLLK